MTDSLGPGPLATLPLEEIDSDMLVIRINRLEGISAYNEKRSPAFKGR